MTSGGTRARVLIVGGSGVFGRRLCERLARHAGMFTIIVAGRDAAKADAVGRSIALADPGAYGGFVRIDRERPDPALLESLGLLAVVDAAGPFQSSSMVLPEACIEAGVNYVDLADGRGFVADIRMLDGAARSAGVCVLSGASSTPALTAAAVDAMTDGWKDIWRIETAITPGNRAPRGLSVVEAILAEAGCKTAVFGEGRWTGRTSFGSWVTRDIPGVGRRRLSLCPTPDLDVLAERYRPKAGAVFRAGLELGLLHVGLVALARGRSLGLIGDLVPLARPLRWAADLMRGFGSDRGAMHVEVSGADRDGRAVRASWTLVAEGNDGPTIPSLAAAAILVAMAGGRLRHAGADAAVGFVTLDDILREGEGLAITAVTTATEMAEPPFAAALGGRIGLLPDATRRLHSSDRSIILDGEATVSASGNAIGRLVSRAFGFPTASGPVACRVLMERIPEGERWVRFFGRQRMESILSHAAPGTVDERFSMVTTRLRIDADGTGLSMVPVGVTAWGMPLPRLLLPRVRAVESQPSEGVHGFDIEIGVPVLGRLVRYEGRLALPPVSSGRASCPPRADAP